jgi:hypothetical protein
MFIAIVQDIVEQANPRCFITMSTFHIGFPVLQAALLGKAVTCNYVLS